MNKTQHIKNGKVVLTMTLREIFIMIKGIKSELAERLDGIDANTFYSNEVKLSMRAQAMDEARARLAEIRDLTDEAVEDFRAKVMPHEKFNYSDPKLTAAIAFIQAAGKALPEAAWREIVEDFEGRPQTLKYLSGLFHAQGAFDAAVAADEAAKAAAIDESFPDRLSDALYYATSGDPTASFDPSGFEAKLDQYEEIQTKDDA